jgi:hypothetical protein
MNMGKFDEFLPGISDSQLRAATRILHFTKGPDDWQALLADPKKHWRTGYSARTLAHCWEAAQGLPLEIRKAFQASTDPLLEHFVPIIAVPEFKVPLPGGGRPSQNDLFVLGRTSAGPVSVMVEGKVAETFGPTVKEWKKDASPGKKERLKFLLKTIGLTKLDDSSRYQFAHRAASAILEGERYRAVAAIMLVHSFNEERIGWADYEHFLRAFKVQAKAGKIQRLKGSQSMPLFAGWIVGDCGFLKS